jgi:lipid-binding SYLF domain-containing protein
LEIGTIEDYFMKSGLYCSEDCSTALPFVFAVNICYIYFNFVLLGRRQRSRVGQYTLTKKEESRIMKIRNVCRILALLLCFTFAFSLVAAVSYAKTKGEIDASVKAASNRFNEQVKGSSAYLKGAKGVLIMPNITKAGFVVGGKYGQGVLQVDGKPVDYYSLTEGSVGWQIGAMQYDMVILFMTDEALKNFRRSEGWEAGVDAEITLIEVGADVSVETLRSQHPVAGFIFDQKGLMGGLSVKGAKFTKINPD